MAVTLETMNKINLHIYQSNFTNESRILRETKALADSGIAQECVIVAVWEEGLSVNERIDDKRRVWRVSTVFKKNPRKTVLRLVMLSQWWLKIILAFGPSNVEMVNCHSLASLPAGVFFKISKGCRLVYDSHELETETASSKGIRRFLAKIAERILINKIDFMIVVCESAADWYKKEYGLPVDKIMVIRNMPQHVGGQVCATGKNESPLRQKMNLSAESILFIYQGILGEGRGVELALDVFSKAGGNKHIVFMGHGSLEDMIKQYAEKYPTIHFQPSVPSGQVLEYTCGADIGLSLIEPSCLNAKFALPNKIFEYIWAEIPVIVSDFPEMARIVDQCHCGWKIEPSADNLARLVRDIDRDSIVERKNNAAKYKTLFDWKNEEKKLVAGYRRVFGQ